jgi:plasmid stabilization system protein ParE
LTTKNAVNERRLHLCGSAVWKVAVGMGDFGDAEILIENPAPDTVFPDPAASTLDECEYVAVCYRMSTARTVRIFADDLARADMSIASVLHAKKGKKHIFDEVNEVCDTLEITEFWFRQPTDGEERVGGVSYTYQAGDIALSILIEGAEVRYVPKFWTKTSYRKYPFVIYQKIPTEGSIWGKSELEPIIPLIDAADRQLAFAQLNSAFFANDVLIYEENAFSPDSFPDNRPGAAWKLRPGMLEKVKRLGGMAESGAAHYEIVERYRKIIKETLGNYDYMQGDYSTNVNTATGLALLSDMASARMNAKPRMEIPQRIYPPHIKSFLLPTRSDNAPINTVVSVAAIALADTMAAISSALA